MPWNFWRTFPVSPSFTSARHPSRGNRRIGAWTFQPRLEALESRIAFNTATWTGNDVPFGIPNWSDFNNWRFGNRPSPGDDVVFPAVPLTNLQSNNDFNGILSLGSIFFPDPTSQQGAPRYLIVGNPITLAGGIFDNTAATTRIGFVGITITASQTWAETNVTNGTPQRGLEIISPINLNGNTLTLSSLGGFQSNFIGSEQDPALGRISGDGALVKSGGGGWALGAESAFTGSTLIADGSLAIYRSHSLGVDANNIIVQSGGTLVFYGPATVQQRLTINGNGHPGSGNPFNRGAIFYTNLFNSPTLAGPITLGSDSTLRADNTANSPVPLNINASVNINSFTLTLDGTLDTNLTGPVSGGGNVLQTSTRTLSGNTTIVGTVNVNQGVLRPGVAGPGMLTSGEVTLRSGTTLHADLAGRTPGAGFSQLNVNGMGHLNSANLDLNLSFTPTEDDAFTIITSTVGLEGTFNGLPNGTFLVLNGQAFRINYVSPGHGPGDIPQQVVVFRRKIPTQTAFLDPPPSASAGQSVTLKASVSRAAQLRAGDEGLALAGTVTFLLDGVSLGNGPVVNGTATLTLAAGLPAGVHTLTASFGGDLNDAPANTAGVSVTVDSGVRAGVPALVMGGAPGRVRVLDGGGKLLADFAPFPGYNGPVNVALGDINRDGFKEVVVAAGAGNPDVRVYNGKAFADGSFNPANPNASSIAEWFPFALNFNVGAYVAVGDINGDGFLDIVTGATVGNPDVRVYSGKDIALGRFNPRGGSQLAQWFAYGLNFNVGATVAVGDIDKDGYADVVTGATAGNPHVKVYSGKALAQGTFQSANPDASLLAQFFPYALQFNVGVNVAVGDINGDGFADIITGATVGEPDVRAFSGQAIAKRTFDRTHPETSQLDQFFAFDAGTNGGVMVGAVDYERTGKFDIVTGGTRTPLYRIVKGTSTGFLPPALLEGVAPNFQGGIAVGA